MAIAPQVGILLGSIDLPVEKKEGCKMTPLLWFLLGVAVGWAFGLGVGSYLIIRSIAKEYDITYDPNYLVGHGRWEFYPNNLMLKDIIYFKLKEEYDKLDNS